MIRPTTTETIIMRAPARTVRRVVTLLALIASASYADAATSKELLDCQKQLESQVRAFSNVVLQGLAGCAQKVVECKLADEIDAVDPTACIAKAAAKCTGLPSKVSDQAAARQAKVAARCGLIPLAEIEQFSEGLGFFNVATSCGAASVTALVGCVFDAARCSAERELFTLDPRAQDSLTTGGIAASFPCVAP
ncbi:hypothetical protein K2Z84_28790 [Candidatus Binatia bacterium]|jgi:hypothetical protein|nr:hypothetical protein [Candidatus Binatia bacterium]